MDYSVLTSENITFKYETAGLASRLLAFIIDGFVIMLITKALFYLFSFLAIISEDMAQAFFIVGFFILNSLYFILFEWIMKGQSIGKKIFRLRVIGEKGLRPSLFQIIIRNSFRIIDQLPFAYLVAGVTSFFSRYSQRLGDLISGTIVINEPKKVLNVRAFKEWDTHNTLIQDQTYSRKILKTINLKEKELLIDLMLRADNLKPKLKAQVFSNFADYFEKKIGLGKPGFLSPENFVKNITYVLIGKPIKKGNDYALH